MAVTCWLTANVSSWASAGSVIYYYDETEPVEEDRIKPYNNLPQSGDTFYMNGYNNTQASGYTINIPNGIIRNDLNPYTGRTGGQATGTGNNGTVNYICKEIHVGDTVFHSQGTNGSATINVTGDIYCEGTAAFFYKAGNGQLYLRVTGNVYRGPDAQLTTAYSDRPGNIIINGNYYGYNVISTSGMNNSVTINGNVEIFASRLCAQTHSAVVIYGNVKLHNNAYLSSAAQTSVAIYGNITLEGQDLFTVKATTVSFYGDRITYSNFDPLNTLFFTDNLSVYSEQLEIERTDDYGESVLISKYQLDNTDQYPPEDEVKEGTEYAWGEKVGTYQQPPESVVLSGYEYDTITAEENDIATYNLTRYIYADYGTLHWFELKTTTTDIVTTPSQQSITIGGETVVADTDYVVEYNDVCYQWSGSAWGSITTKNIGMVKTDIVTNPTETTLGVKKGTLETSNISQQLISRLENCATVETVQQLLVAHLDN